MVNVGKYIIYGFYGSKYIILGSLHIGNGCLTKHPFFTGCLEFQLGVGLKEFFNFHTEKLGEDSNLYSHIDTLLGTNISREIAIFKMIFLFQMVRYVIVSGGYLNLHQKLNRTLPTDLTK